MPEAKRHTTKNANYLFGGFMASDESLWVNDLPRWIRDDCIVIDKANIVIDLFKDGRIGGIEFLSLFD